MKDGVVGEKTIETYKRLMNRARLEKRYKRLENEKRLAFKDYLITGNVSWYEQVIKELEAITDEIFARGGRIVCKGLATVIDWGDEA